MEISVADVEIMTREFMDVETQVVRGYAIEYAREIYNNVDNLAIRETARRNMYLCIFGMLENSGLGPGAERRDFLNHETTAIVTQAALDTDNTPPAPLNDSSKSWHRRKGQLFGALIEKGRAPKDEYPFSIFVALHENRSRFQHDLTEYVS